MISTVKNRTSPNRGEAAGNEPSPTERQRWTDIDPARAGTKAAPPLGANEPCMAAFELQAPLEEATLVSTVCASPKRTCGERPGLIGSLGTGAEARLARSPRGFSTKLSWTARPLDCPGMAETQSRSCAKPPRGTETTGFIRTPKDRLNKPPRKNGDDRC